MEEVKHNIVVFEIASLVGVLCKVIYRYTVVNLSASVANIMHLPPVISIFHVVLFRFYNMNPTVYVCSRVSI